MSSSSSMVDANVQQQLILVREELSAVKVVLASFADDKAEEERQLLLRAQFVHMPHLKGLIRMKEEQLQQKEETLQQEKLLLMKKEETLQQEKLLLQEKENLLLAKQEGGIFICGCLNPNPNPFLSRRCQAGGWPSRAGAEFIEVTSICAI